VFVVLGSAVMAKKGQCERCTGLCCRYYITVFVEDGDWYINIRNKCRHLSEKDYHCRIYDKRPRICRQYRHADCDLVEGEYDYELHFTSDKQMEEYIKIKFDNSVAEERQAKRKKRKKKNR